MIPWFIKRMTQAAAVVLVADECNTMAVAADENLAVASDDTGFGVPAASQSFDVEGCE